METETITYDNYLFKIELDKNQININMTDNTNTLMEIYEGTVKEDDVYVKPIKKFYLMIISALNEETSFNFSIDNQNSKMICTVSYNTIMVDMEEHIILNKIPTSESSENLLVRKVKELEYMLTPVFGRCYNTQERMMFNLDSTVLDFRPFNYTGLPEHQLSKKNYKYFISYNLNITEYNKFTKVKEIIYDAVLSPIYYHNSDKYDTNYIFPYTFNNSRRIFNVIENINIFKSFKVYLPSVVEVKIFYSKLYEYTDNTYIDMNISNEMVNAFNKTNEIMFPSFPNLKKLTLINNVTDPPLINTNRNRHNYNYYVQPRIDISTLIIQLECNKKINHIILKGIPINQESLENNKLEALKKNIKLEIS